MKPGQAAVLQTALMHQRAGRLDDARKLYEQVIRRDPQNADALHLLGLVLLDRGEAAKGLQLLRRAISYAPESVELLNNLAVELCRLGRIAEALPVYDKVLARDPRRADVQLNRARALRDMGRETDAMAALDRLIAQDPGNAVAHAARGSFRAALEGTSEALVDFDAALAIDGRNAEFHGNRANALMVLRRFDDAAAAFGQALALRPDDPALLHRRGLCLHALDREAEAREAYDAALAAGGDGPDLLNNYAATLVALGCHAEAGRYFQAALEQRPGDAETLFGLASVLLALHQPQSALECLDAGLALNPGCAAARHNRAAALIQLGRYADAAAALTGLLSDEPGYEYARGERLFARLYCCDWSGYAAETSGIAHSVGLGQRADMPFMSLAHAESGETQRRCAEILIADKYPPRAPDFVPTKDSPKIHIAYLSGDFRTHATSFLMAGVFEQHDRARFDVTAISFQPPDDSEMGRRVHAAFDRFIDISGKTDAEASALMRELGVDIAVDLMGHTLGGRPGLLAARAAPVQVNYLGYPGTMGATYIDAIIADGFVIPPGHEPFYTESIVRLPHCFQANDDRRSMAPVPTRAEAGLPGDGFVFCCFASCYKITPPIFAIAMRLLAAVPGSVLWLAAGPSEARANLQSAAISHGIDPARLVFARQAAYSAHLARLSLAGLVLDTYPFNGGTTVSDALWAGTPVVTLAGQPFAARMAGSLLQTVGLADLITGSFAEYERVALHLAQDPDALAAVRRRLQEGITTSPLFDTAAFCRDFETALTALHHGSR